MSALIPEEHRLFADSVEQVLGDLYVPGARATFARAAGGFSQENWAMFAELGWLGAMVPESAGGYGDGVSETTLLFERAGASLVVEPLLDCALIPGQLLARVGGEAAFVMVGQLIAGTRRLVLLDGGPDSGPLFTAARTEGGYRVSGRAPVVRGAPGADGFLVYAVLDDGTSLLLFIDKNTATLRQSTFSMIDSAMAGEVTLDAAIVADEALIAAGPAVRAALDWTYQIATLAICAEAIGAMDRCVWITRDYLTTRKQFGQPLAAFQALQHRMADMLVELELARALVQRVTLTLLDAPSRDRERLVSACKFTIARAGKFISANAIQLHGGIGVTDEYIIGHYFKRLLAIAYQLGDADFHRERFARI